MAEDEPNENEIIELLSFRKKVTYRPWKDVPTEDISEEIVARNGGFQVMLSFMRMAPMPAIVTDCLGRVLFMNPLAENYVKARVWESRGKFLNELIHLSASDAAIADRHRDSVLGGGGAMVTMETYRTGSQRITVCTFPFRDNSNEMLAGIFLLPQNLPSQQF